MQARWEYMNKTATDCWLEKQCVLKLEFIIKALWKSTFLEPVVSHLSQCPANKNSSSLLLVPHLFCKQEIKLPFLGPSQLKSSYTITGTEDLSCLTGSGKKEESVPPSRNQKSSRLNL